MSSLFSPLKIKTTILRNRIVVSPMCQYSSTDGFSNEWHMVHLGSRAVGGAGLVIAEATAVSPEGRITPGDLGIWHDGHIEGLSRIARFIKRQGSAAGIQIAHAGRKASCAVPWEGGQQLSIEKGGWETVAPSAIPFREGERLPLALSREAIKSVIADFREAALRAQKAGFDVLEIHSAHGYLLFEFLSPLSNKRTDEYGGIFENRIRLLCEVIESVHQVWPSDKPLFVRISATEWTEGQWSPEESVKLAMVLKNMHVDLIDCSSGGNVPYARIPTAPGYQVHLAEAVRTTGIMTGAVGLITSAAQAEEIISQGKADVVLLAREFLRNPYFPIKAAKELNADIPLPPQYLRSKE